MVKRKDVRQTVFFDFAFRDEEIWFCDTKYNALFKYSITNNKLKFVTMLSKVNDLGLREGYSSLAFYKNKLIIAPKNSIDIVIYDTETGNIERVCIQIPRSKWKKGNYFRHIEVIENTAYLFPGSYPAILKLNIDTLQVEYLDEWYIALKNRLDRMESGSAIFLSFHRSLESCYMSSWHSNLIFTFNLKTEEWVIQDLGKTEKGIADVLLYGDDILFSYKDSNGIFNNKNNLNIITDNLELNLFESQGYKFFNYHNYIYACPRIGCEIIRLENYAIKDYKIKKIQIKETKESKKYITRNKSDYICYKQIDATRILLLSNRTGGLILVDLETGNYDYFEMVLSEDDLKKLDNVDFCFENCECEFFEDETSLNEFLYLINKYNQQIDKNKKIYTVGEKIYACKF